MWHYRALLPIAPDVEPVTLCEGATPLVPAARLHDELGLAELTFKYEGANPTGAFKDRQISVGITHAKSLGADTVAVMSSGNVACSTAAYAARAGMRAVVFMHALAAPAKRRIAAAYGARVLAFDTPSSNAVFELCREACAKFGWYNLTTAGMYAPYNVEGAKTIAYELYQQTNGELFDWLVVPVGGGGMLGAVWRGFLDLQRLGLIDRPPRLIGVQPSGCAPFVRAIDQIQTFQEMLATPWPNPQTVAGGLADDILYDGHTALPAIRHTNGRAIAVTDAAILAAQTRLAEREGLLVEPSSAVVIAALEHAASDLRGARICALLTGAGFNDLPPSADADTKTLPLTLDAVAEVVARAARP